MKKFIMITAFLLLAATDQNVFSQWSSNPETNLQISDPSGEQVLPKIANTADGGTFIAWFDNRSGSYAVYLQKLNAAGVKQFAADGLLVSGNPQSSSLVDWDMISDDDNNAIIVFTDTRAGSQINPYAYKISSAGTFLWGANGITLASDINTFQANPKVIKTSDNNFVITWVYSSSPNKICFQKLSSTGTKLWGTDPVYLSGTGSENFTYPSLVASDIGGVIALWSGYTGSFLSPGNYRLYSQKFTAAGTVAWTDTVYSLGRVSGFFTPKIFSDNEGGALYVWQDDRNSTNLQTSYVQHISAGGFKGLTENGIAISTMAGVNMFDASACYDSTSGFTYVVWKQSNSLQSQFQIYGQAISPFNIRTWTDNGKMFADLATSSAINQLCFVRNGYIVFTYNEALFGSNNNLVKAFATDVTGNVLWGSTPISVASSVTPKSRLTAALDNNSMLKVAWSDERSGPGGIYAQNVNSNGSLGLTEIQTISTGIPDAFTLSQNYPNPFNPVTMINYTITGSELVSLKVFDILGNEIAVLVNQRQSPGSYRVSFEGGSVPSGIYFYKIKAGNFTDTKRMMLIK